MIALSKADGGVRGIVAGDVMWRLVANDVSAIDGICVVGQISVPARHGHQGRMRMHFPRVELNPNATILSVNGMSAYDTISRRAMLQGLSYIGGGGSALPFCEHVQWKSFAIFVGGRAWSHPHNPPGRGRRAR